MRGMDAGSVDAIITDPPYGSTRTTIGGADGCFHDGKRSSAFGQWDIFDTQWLSVAARLLRVGGAVVAFCPEWGIGRMRDAAPAAHLRWRQVWYWHKSNPPMTFRGVLQFAVEPMSYMAKGPHRVEVENAGRAHNVFHFPLPTDPARRWHPNQKPVDLMRHIVRLVAHSGGTILDPFCGSGSTLVAAAMEGFDSVGIDADAHYCDIARRRAYAAAQPRLALGGEQ